MIRKSGKSSFYGLGGIIMVGAGCGLLKYGFDNFNKYRNSKIID